MSALEPATAARAARIRPHLERAAESLFAVGDELVQAKEELPHGQFGALLAELGMAPRVAQKFMAIARNPVLRNATPGSHLPAGLTVLYELSRVPDEELEDAIDAGEVTPGTTRAAAEALRAAPGDAGDTSISDDALTPRELEQLAAAERVIDGRLETMLLGLEAAGGIAQLRLLDELLRGLDEADEGDRTIRTVLLCIVLDAMDGISPPAEGDDPVGRLSGAIADALRHLRQSDYDATMTALPAVAAAASQVSEGVRGDVLLQVLDGRKVEDVHPTTRLVVNALLAGFALEQVPA